MKRHGILKGGLKCWFLVLLGGFPGRFGGSQVFVCLVAGSGFEFKELGFGAVEWRGLVRR